jgi:hypothetical protein
MKRLFTTLMICSAMVSISGNSLAQNMHSMSLQPNRHQPVPVQVPFNSPKTYLPIGSHNSPLAAEDLSYFDPTLIDPTTGAIDNTKILTFGIPDTTTVFDTQLGDSVIYYSDMALERFTSSFSTIYLDSVTFVFVADSINGSRIAVFVYQDTIYTDPTTSNQYPAVNPNLGVLASYTIPKTAMKNDSFFTVYTLKTNHRLLRIGNTISPNSFYVALTTFPAVTDPESQAPAQKSRIHVLSDNHIDVQRDMDGTIDRSYHIYFSFDQKKFLIFSPLAGRYINPSTQDIYYPNFVMIAHVSDGQSGVDDVKLEGNALGQNYPNPFNPSTQIKYSIANESVVSLKVYNTLGVEVATIVNDNEAPGQHQVTFAGDNLPSGTYFYTLKAGTFSQTKRMVISK